MEGGLTASDIFKMMTAGLANPTLPGVKEAMSLAKLAATPPDPYGASGDMVKSARKGDYLSALETGFGAIPTTGAIRAYHGSPHSFDRFDMSKIGTGEGAQVYGHGLYFADNEAVARGYKEALSPYGRGNAPEDVAARVLHATKNDREAALEELRRRIDDANARRVPYDEVQQLMQARNVVNTKPEVAGHMYEVRINADPEHFIDWDKPLSEQGGNVAKLISDRHDLAAEANKWSETGNGLWIAAGNRTKDAARASEALRKAGIPGIKYLDQGSRGAGEGSRNYVVFDDKLIDIMRKYGIVGAAPLAALGISAQPQQTPEM